MDIAIIGAGTAGKAVVDVTIALNATHGGAWQSGWKLVAAPATIPVGAGV